MPAGTEKMATGRKLNEMFHIENNRLVKTSNGEPVPDDEPVFVFRARDLQALGALNYYIVLCMNAHLDPDRISQVRKCRDRFQDFKAVHPDRMKNPGVTGGM